ncbi:Importin-9 [Rhynchospora pubera]|uniref:Importin-9 n=1 Tax=Rhynchospora pubera TaxID=906938 RepID=A0AAV8HJ46_9POAL|nr:Importin-9 [Rhynchospora pubera]
MESSLDPDQKCLIDCLSATLDTSHGVRSFAEESLKQASLQPGYGAALAKIIFNKEIPFGLRQLSAVLLKQFIKQHWQEDEENFVPPIVSPEEKGVIRQLLMLSLDDSHGKIHTAVGMTIATIGQYDWPEEWPELLPFLLRLINDQNNQNGVRGALRCLALLSGDLDDASVPKLVPELFPSLHKIISSPELYEKSLRAKALSIAHACISVLGSMSGVYQRETMDMVNSILAPLMEKISILLQSPVQSEDPDDWSLRMEVLKCLLQIVQNFPAVLDGPFLGVLAPLWQTFISSFKVYQLSCVQGTEDSHSGRYDSDGVEQSFEALVIQLFELLITIVCNSRLAKAIGGSIKELVYYVVGFQQMTEEQEHSWSVDANHYVADEDDATYSCRVSGSLLLEEIINTYAQEGINSILEASQARFHESHEAKVAGHSDWWKWQEASLFALSSISDQLLEIQESEPTKYNLGELIEQMVTESTGAGVDVHPFLHARAFAMVAKFHSVISKSTCEQFLYRAAQTIALDVSLPVKIGACRALSQVLPESKQEAIQLNTMGLLSSLTDLLTKASEETLHLVLETLQATINAAGEQFALVESVLSPIILNVWAQHISDPFISIDAVDVLEAIKNAPGCIQPLVSRILPTIVPILQKPKDQRENLVGGSLDLLTMLLKNAPIDVVQAIFEKCFDPTVQIILESEDHAEMQNATECLAVFVSVGRQEMLTWGGDPGYIMKRLLEAASRLLDPELPSSVSLFVGSYILQLILHLPTQMSPHLRDLVAAVVRRLQSSEIEGLKCSLILILARLVHLSAPNTDHFINLLLSMPAAGYENSLSYVMSEWTRLQGEIQGAYQIKVTTTALVLLFSTRNVELSKLQVKGNLIKNTGGIKTRSKSKSAPDQWTLVPLPAKIFSLLADALSEIFEQPIDDDDEDGASEASYTGDEIMYASMVPSNANPSVQHLDAMAKVLDEDDEDDGYDDDLTKVDPLSEINLAEYLQNFFRSISESDRSLFDYLFQSLSESQRASVARGLSS